MEGGSNAATVSSRQKAHITARSRATPCAGGEGTSGIGAHTASMGVAAGVPEEATLWEHGRVGGRGNAAN